MHNKTDSAASIEANINTPRQEYISNLKRQCLMQEEASQIAQALIATYQNDNLALRQELSLLSQQLRSTEQQLQQTQQQLHDKKLQLSQLQHIETNNNIMEKNILKYSERVNELLEQNLLLEQKNRSLELQIKRYKGHRQEEKETLKSKLMAQQRQQLEGHFHNFLKLGQPESVEYSPQSSDINIEPRIGKIKGLTVNESSRKRSQKGEEALRVMEWKLKQKEEEIVILLKRLRGIEEMGKPAAGRRKDRVLTSDSADNYYSINSHKKNNISEFTH